MEWKTAELVSLVLGCGIGPDRLSLHCANQCNLWDVPTSKVFIANRRRRGAIGGILC